MRASGCSRSILCVPHKVMRSARPSCRAYHHAPHGCDGSDPTPSFCVGACRVVRTGFAIPIGAPRAAIAAHAYVVSCTCGVSKTYVVLLSK